MIKRLILVVWTALYLSLSAQGQVNKGLQPGPGPTPIPGKRIALVIGNAKYQHGTPLKNPVNDAELMEQTLRELNFEVITKKNAGLKEMVQSMNEFHDKIEKGNHELALCYYSGHGLEVHGKNFLMPVDANPARQSDVSYTCLDAQRILDGMEDARAVTKIMILDACRDNPLPKGWDRSSGGGLVVLPAPEGSLVAYATASKTTAWDGEGKNSPYTAALARYLKEPGLEIAQVLTRTAAATRDAAKQVGRVQTPISSNSLTGDLFLVPVQGPREPVVPAPDPVVPEVGGHGPLVGKMILIKGGMFEMGCTGEQEGCDSDEKPVHRVTLGDYYLGETEVTLRSFRTFIQETGYQTDAERDGGSYVWNGSSWEKKQGVDWRCDETGKVRLSSEGNYPVLHVSWNDAVAFCDWLTEKQGVRYRLPTEAEWEYAARGGKESRGYQYSGSNSLEEVGWYNENSGGRLHTVKGKRPNELGLYDMSGNVWEWCSDWKGDYSSAAQMNPVGAASGSGRVHRGGSWDDNPAYCRVADRFDGAPDNRYSGLGFRLARTF